MQKVPACDDSQAGISVLFGFKQLSLDQRNKRTVSVANLFQTGNTVTYFCQEYAADHIHDHVLSGGQGGNTNSHGENKGQPTVNRGNGFILSNARPAKPAVETVDGGEEIIRRVNAVKQLHAHIPQAISGDLRPHIGGGQQNEKQQADSLSQGIGAEEAVTILRTLFGAEIIIDGPEQIASEVNGNCPGQKWNQRVHGEGQIVVIEALGDPPAADIHNLVPKQGKGTKENNFLKFGSFLQIQFHNELPIVLENYCAGLLSAVPIH